MRENCKINFFDKKNIGIIFHLTSNLLRHPSYIIRLNSYVNRHTSYILRLTSNLLRLTSSIIRHPSNVIRLTSILFLLTFLLSSCVPGEKNEALDSQDPLIVVGFSQLGSESDWRNGNTRSMQEAFSLENGYRLIFDDAQQKQEKQLISR